MPENKSHFVRHTEKYVSIRHKYENMTNRDCAKSRYAELRLWRVGIVAGRDCAESRLCRIGIVATRNCAESGLTHLWIQLVEVLGFQECIRFDVLLRLFTILRYLPYSSATPL